MKEIKNIFIIITTILLINQIFSHDTSNPIFVEENGVLQLDDKNFDSIIEKRGPIFVMFYAPWCSHCKEISTEFEKAAKELKHSNLNLGKVDSATETNVTKKYNIQIYPTFLLIWPNDQKKIEFEEKRISQNFVNFVLKHTIEPLRKLTNSKDAKSFIKQGKTSIIYIGDKPEILKEYKKVSIQFIEYPFAYCTSDCLTDIDFLKKYKLQKGEIFIFKNFDEKKNIYSLKDIESTESIDKKFIKFSLFVKRQVIPKLLFYDEETAEIIFSKKYPALILFCNKNDTVQYNKYRNLLSRMAVLIISKGLRVVLADINEDSTKKLANFIAVKTDIPTIRILDTSNYLKKYQMKEKITDRNIIKFINKFQKNTLEEYYKSQSVPAEKDNNEPIRKIVGKTFKEEVLKNKKNVLIFIDAPWCLQCQEFAKNFEAAALMLKNNKNLVFAYMDGSKNECEDLYLDVFPDVRYYNSTHKPEYSLFEGHIGPNEQYGEKTYQELINWIQNLTNFKLDVTPYDSIKHLIKQLAKELYDEPEYNEDYFRNLNNKTEGNEDEKKKEDSLDQDVDTYFAEDSVKKKKISNINDDSDKDMNDNDNDDNDFLSKDFVQKGKDNDDDDDDDDNNDIQKDKKAIKDLKNTDL